MLSMVARKDAADPAPISIMVITAAMPITIPSMVRSARVGFRKSARNAMEKVFRIFIQPLLR